MNLGIQIVDVNILLCNSFNNFNNNNNNDEMSETDR